MDRDFRSGGLRGGNLCVKRVCLEEICECRFISGVECVLILLSGAIRHFGYDYRFKMRGATGISLKLMLIRACGYVRQSLLGGGFVDDEDTGNGQWRVARG